MSTGQDRRNIRNGWTIPTESYSDQPYVVKTGDGAWLCVVTTGAGHEGAGGQHVVTLRSTDRGRTWSDPVDVEPASGPEASYAVLLRVPDGYPAAGRIFVFYNHNTDDIREVVADATAFPDGRCHRVDSLGHYVFKVSDDGGRSWSPQRYDIPMRTMEIDRRNPYNGELKFFWNVGKPFILDGAALCSLHKVGGFGEGFFTSSEGVLLKSANLLTETDPGRITWETLPDGETGLRTPPGGGPVAEEQSYVVLSDGSIYVTYRTVDGYAAEAYSRDGGHTWSRPAYRTYADDRRMKHPRAATFVWRCENGRYLCWFHNHGGRFIAEHPHRRTIAYEDRNPVWLSGGVEVDGPEGKLISWSQPEICLYDDDPYIRISYPDLIEAGGRLFLTETQKDVARVHAVAPALLEALWHQGEVAEVTRESLILEWSRVSSGTLPSQRSPTEEENSAFPPPGRNTKGELSVGGHPSHSQVPSPRPSPGGGGRSAFPPRRAGPARRCGENTKGRTHYESEVVPIAKVPLSDLPPFLTRDTDRADYGTRDLRHGFSLGVWLRLGDLRPDQIVLDSRTPSGQGFALLTAAHGTLEVVLNDGRTENRWTCDPGVLRAGTLHHVVVTVDGGPKIITFVVDGVLNDGDEARQFGWGRFSPNLRGVDGAGELRIAPDLNGEVVGVRIYARALLTSEAVANYLSGPARVRSRG